MLAEIVLGRLGRQNPVNTLQHLSHAHKKNPNWRYLGFLGAITLVLVLSFYSVVAGWSLAYIPRAFKGVFNHLGAEQILGVWRMFLK